MNVKINTLFSIWVYMFQFEPLFFWSHWVATNPITDYNDTMSTQQSCSLRTLEVQGPRRENKAESQMADDRVRLQQSI